MAEEAKDNVSYEMLQDLLRSERRSNKLMPVSARFWPQVREFLQMSLESFRVEQAKDPFSRKVMMLSDQAKNAKAAAEALWALRERKMAMVALASTKERKTPEGLAPDEGMLYQRIVDVLEEGRARAFEGTTPIPPPGLPVASAPAAGPAIEAVAAPSSPPNPAYTPPLAPPLVPVLEVAKPAPAVVQAASPSQPVVVPADTTSGSGELVTIRALGDIPPFVGPDMQTYLLKAGDMASVPPQIANLLVRRGKATQIDV